ncbi:MAG: class I SAM-dependent methyltransferase [bacterium]
MKMSKIEKRFVNSKRHAQKNLEFVERLFNRIDLHNTTQVLEIGCGVGIVSAHLTNRYNMNVVGIDLDSEQIAIAKMYNNESEHLKFIEADSTKLPFRNQEFDMVLSLYVMHHIGNWEKTLEEINRVLKPNGYFIFYDLAYSRFTTRIFRPIVNNYGVYTIGDVTHCLRKNNFETIHKEEPKGIIMKNYSMVFRKLE